jgi:acetyltransferase
MRHFMEPKSVALVGLTRDTGLGGWNTLENLLNYGYEGKLYPVNPAADEILGVRCYPSVESIPDVADLAVILTPSYQVPPLIKECTDKHIKAIIVVAQGLADGDADGANLQREIVRLARAGGARIVGPNTFGTGNAFVKFNSAFTYMDMKEVPYGVICQTGLFMSGLPDFPMVGKCIDLGNTGDIDFADGLEYFEDDPQVKIIFLYIEGMQDGRRFMEVAQRVSRKKPIIAIKAGQSEAASQATRSHSGNLSGNDEAYEAAFRKCGIIRTTGTEEFQDLGRAFTSLPLMKGRGVGLVTITGGGGILAMEALSRHGLHLAKLTTESQRRLDAISPEWQKFGNPADIWPPSMISGIPLWDVLHTVIQTFLDDESVDGLFIIMPGVPSEYIQFMSPLVDAFKLINDYEKPAVLWCYSTEVDAAVELFCSESRTLYYSTMDRAANALSRLNEYHEFLHRDDKQ